MPPIPGPAPPGRPFPDLVFAPVRGDALPDLRPRNRTILLPHGRSLIFKSAEDAAGCAVAPLAAPDGASGDLISVDTRRCTRETRVLFDLDGWDRCAILDLEPVLTVTLRAEVLALEPAAVDAVQWIRLLTRHGATEQRHLVLVDKKVKLRREGGAQSWTFEVPPAPDSDGPLLLAFQLAPGSGPVAFGSVALRLNALRSGAGCIETVGADGVGGWLDLDSGTAAALDLRLDDGPPATIALADRFVRPARSGARRGEFAVPFEMVLGRLGSAATGELSLGLRRGDMTVAARRARIAAAPVDAGDGAAAGGPGRVLLAADALSAAALAREDGHVIFERLAEARDRRLTRETLTLLAASHTDGRLYTVHDLVERAEDPAGELAAYADLCFAKAMLAMNAAETAFRMLERLVGRPERLAELEASEQHGARLQLARAAFYSGRRDHAAEVLWQAMTDQPLDWRCYFQLGQVLAEADPDQAQTYFEVVHALEPGLPDRERQALIERLLDRGAVKDALLMTLLAMRASETPDEYLLSLANIEIAAGRAGTWARYVNRYFESLELEPALGACRGETVDIFDVLALDGPPGRGSDGGSARVTVVIACRDAAETIAASVRSVLAQSYGNLRVVVVDDDSADATAAIVRDLAQGDDRLTLMRNERNMGTYWSRNRAISEIDSDYYTIHDADDWMHPGRIAAHVAFAAERPDIVCSQSMWLRMERTGRVIIQRGRAFVHENPASIFLPRRIFDEVGYFDCVRAGADSEYVWRLRHRFGGETFAKIPLPLGIGLHHAGSITQSGAYAFDVHRYSAVRLRYAEAWVKWQLAGVRGEDRLHVPFSATERRFEAPPEMLP